MPVPISIAVSVSIPVAIPVALVVLIFFIRSVSITLWNGDGDLADGALVPRSVLSLHADRVGAAIALA